LPERTAEIKRKKRIVTLKRGAPDDPAGVPAGVPWPPLSVAMRGT
jgi:hypothetical protein